MNTGDALRLLELNAPITRADLKRAYREALMVWHPDRFADNASLKAKATSRTQMVKDAYERLSDIPDREYPFREGQKHEPAMANSNSSEAAGRARPSQAAPVDGPKDSNHRTEGKRRMSVIDRLALGFAGLALIGLASVIAYVWPQTSAQSIAAKTIADTDINNSSQGVKQPHSKATSGELVVPFNPPPPQAVAPKLAPISLTREPITTLPVAPEKIEHSIEELVELGDAYYFGRNGPKSSEEAAKWWTKAAKMGDSNAQFNVGRCYALGDGVPRNVTEAIKWYEKAGSLGHSDALCNLAAIYISGNGVAKDVFEAFRLTAIAAKKGNSRAQLNLGNFYHEGNGVEPDEFEAARWYKASAEQGNPDAQFYLGLAYADGSGITEDDVEAYKWYLLAAEGGQPSAKDLLADYKVSPEVMAEAKIRAERLRRSVAARPTARPQNIQVASPSDARPPALSNQELAHLPGDTRPLSGAVMTNQFANSGSKGRLSVDNGLSEDAYIKLVHDEKLAAAFYVRGGKSFSLDDIPDGSYTVLFCTGYGWNATQRDFERGRQARRYDSSFVFETRRTRDGDSIVVSTDVMTLTLHSVAKGNTHASAISLQEFDKY